MHVYGNATLTMSDSMVAGNAGGGGLAVNGSTATVTGSTFTGNAAYGGGGVSAFSGGSVELVNCTISGNDANAGGGIRAFSESVVRLVNVTLTGNTAGEGPAIDNDATVYATNTLFDDDCSGDSVIISSGGNVDGGTSCQLSSEFDLSDVGDLMLGPLGDHGGPTWTHLPWPSSPAVGAAVDALCPAVDQRGWARPPAGCEAGAVELQAAELPFFYDRFESGDVSGWSAATP
jgi:hypothetical protein